jgi:hypothetical protein
LNALLLLAVASHLPAVVMKASCRPETAAGSHQHRMVVLYRGQALQMTWCLQPQLAGFLSGGQKNRCDVGSVTSQQFVDVGGARGMKCRGC